MGRVGGLPIGFVDPLAVGAVSLGRRTSMAYDLADNGTWSTLTYDSANQLKQLVNSGTSACRSIRALRIAMIRRVCGRRSLRPMATA